MKTFSLREGHEVRGMMIRLYPTAEQEAALKIIESDLRSRWNWLCAQTQQVIDARKAYAVRQGLVGPLPTKPDCDGMEPEETKAAWAAYRDACREWNHAVYVATDKVPCCAWRPKLKEEIERFGFKHDYQFFGSKVFQHGVQSDTCNEHGDVKVHSAAYQALVKNFYSGKAKGGKGRAANQRRKQFRRASDSMPLQVRSGDCFKVGNFGERGSQHHKTIGMQPENCNKAGDFGTMGKGARQFYDCQISFNGLKIRGRIPGRAPWGRVLQGVSITKQADGWWASIKQEIPIRALPECVPGMVIGIDAGLDILAAMSDGTMVDNPRERIYSERIAGRQAEKKPVGRLQQAAARQIRHLIYNKIVKHLGMYEQIRVERLNGRIGQMGGSRKQSAMRLMVQLLRDRYGDRVREVDPAYTSQDCSRCGHRSKDAWAGDADGKVRTCPACGLRMHRDLNAAINIASREPYPLASGEVVTETRVALATNETATEQASTDMAAE